MKNFANWIWRLKSGDALRVGDKEAGIVGDSAGNWRAKIGDREEQLIKGSRVSIAGARFLVIAAGQGKVALRRVDADLKVRLLKAPPKRRERIRPFWQAPQRAFAR